MKKLLSLEIIFLLLTSLFLIFIATPQAKAKESDKTISIFSFSTDPTLVFLGENFTYTIRVKNLDSKPVYLTPISYESFDPPESVSIVEDRRPYVFVYPVKLNPGEVTSVRPFATFNAKKAGEVKITVKVYWSYSEAGPHYEAAEIFSFGILIDLSVLPEIAFLTEPPDVGSITFSGTTYISGQSGKYTAGTYQIEANVPKGYIFYNWVTTGGISVVNSESRQTTASVTGSGSLIAVFKWSVKLRGMVISHVQYPDGWPAVDVKVEELLLDTSNRLKVSEVVEVYRETPFTEISDGDRVEVYGLGFWIGNPPGGPYVEHGIVIKWPEHYLRKKNASWTVMAYLAGDCDSKNLLMIELPIMESKAIRILNDLEKIGSTSEINIVALLDRHPKYDSSNGNWSDTRVFFVTKDSSDEINSKWESWGELNTGNYKTLSAFINWSINSYPAEHYFLILVGHGNGWRGVCPDETDGDELNATELNFALSKINDTIDVILFDSCLMGMTEIICELKNHVRMVVASEDYIREHTIEAILPGIPYDEILRCLVENPNMSAAELGKTIVQKFKEANQYKPPYLATISAINVTRINELLNAFDDLSIFLNAKMEKYLKDLIEIRNKIANSNEEYGKNKLEKFADDCDYIDLYYFAQLLKERIPETGEVVDRLLNTINSLIVEEWHQVLHSNSHGLSIYYPKNRASYEYSSYRRLSLSQTINWDEFLSNYVNSKIQSHPIIYLDGKVGDTHIDVPITVTNMFYNIHVITFDIVELTKSRYKFSAPILGFFPNVGLCIFDHWKVITSSGVEERRDNPLSYEVKNEETLINAHYDKVLEGTLVRLNEIGHKLYLHVYDNLGRHIGMNYTTGTVEIQIPRAGYLDLNNGTMLILLPLNVTDFQCVIDAKYAEAEKEEYELTVISLKEGRDVAKTMRKNAVERGAQQAFNCNIDLEKKEARMIAIRPEAEIYLLLQHFWYFFIIVAVIGIAIAYGVKKMIKMKFR